MTGSIEPHLSTRIRQAEKQRLHVPMAAVVASSDVDGCIVIMSEKKPLRIL